MVVWIALLKDRHYTKAKDEIKPDKYFEQLKWMPKLFMP